MAVAWLALCILKGKLPLINRIVISKQLVTFFRKYILAAYPHEGMMTLWGRVEGDTVVISSLRTPEQKGTVDRLDYHLDDAAGPQAEIRGEQYLGTWHSHPEGSDATPSAADWDSSYSSGERVFGIMWCSKQSNGRFKTSNSWWEPRPEIQMVHPRVRGQNANRNKKQQTESKGVQVSQEVPRTEAS